MSAPPPDSLILDPGFATKAMAELFSPDHRVSCMLAFEAGLARAQAALLLIPQDAAAAITAACTQTVKDGTHLLVEGWQVGTVVAPLLAAIRGQLPVEWHPHLHLGATTQDVLDTASALQMQAGSRQLLADLLPLVDRLATLASEHRATPIMARTLMQPAEVTSFGWSLCRWLAPLIGAATTLQQASEALPLQLGGAVGALCAFETQGPRLAEALANELGLAAPAVPWHGDRKPVLDVLHGLILLAQALRKAAGDLILLAQGEVAEVRMRGGVSSAMPHKQNPIDATQAVTAAEACLQSAAALLGGRAHELERACGGWQLEWLFVPLAFTTCAAALQATTAAFAHLTVDRERMRTNAGGDTARVPVSTDPLIDRVLTQAQVFRTAQPHSCP